MSTKEHNPSNELHVPVLLNAALEYMHPMAGENYLDLTAGYGGHANRFLDMTKNYTESVLVDRDDYAVQRLESLQSKGVRVMHTDFLTAAKQLVSEGSLFDMVFIDLGVSSPQLDQIERGFSFKNSGPLDMRMDRRQELSAKTLVNQASADELARIINQYGEEPIGFSRTIAQTIVASRPLNTTGELADLIVSKYRGGWKKHHPATRTFQAIRIAVNDELRQIEDMLPLLPDLLKPGGRVGIISFHSLEDRLVKRYLKEQFDAGFEARLMPITKKPLSGEIYDVHNPRSRSSKLRVAVKK